ncbi:tRNA (adenosine(37)-N6)-threonylcarbamoyltransferase complex ATPase subunit type 1 TsaE [Leifsonia sp. fls2-241-R2A-40a]|uniref:tRNA (adenosine(37)-N6)-threonylcarbamoyltransferase complex ATPase subunit type 1 TsaE n=1 Tax=Leifsonia sp. fls2-241-R2A-40a TaxID=3040290 RepID=UPI00254C18FF|nr:tRNA (adenosine(37)-N6)-threonylcarbamoyltransferase complex ATPase subunit type 1 TsaE [Leifsonia sp. fls2-241-R2A-40a]
MTVALSLPSTRRVATADDMHALGRELAGALRAGDLVILSGPLGAGKTTLTRGIGEGLGVRGPVTSPTFVLARTHPRLSGGAPLVHVDAYRLSSALELDDLDIDFARSVVVVEWGTGMLDGVADSWLEVAIERPTGAEERAAGEDRDGVSATDEVEETDEPRTVTLTGFGPRWAAGTGSPAGDRE